MPVGDVDVDVVVRFPLFPFGTREINMRERMFCKRVMYSRELMSNAFDLPSSFVSFRS